MNHPDNEILARYLSGESTADETEAVNSWAAENPKNGKMLQLLQQAWNLRRKDRYSWNLERLWEKISAQTGLDRKNTSTVLPFIRRIFASSLVKAAAVFLVLAAGSLGLFRVFTGESVFTRMSYETVAVEKGKHETLTLSDGSEITLDAGSTLRYRKSFSETERNVYLTGEGYFTVAHDPKRPFKVHTKNGIVQVLGTSFNVSSWQSGHVTVVVTGGKVSLRPNDSRQSGNGILLLKGQMGSVSAQGVLSGPVPVNTDDYLSWIRREKRFQGVPLRTVLDYIERWYDLEIEVAGHERETDLVTFHISERPVREILDMIALIMDFRYEADGKMITFRKKE